MLLRLSLTFVSALALAGIDLIVTATVPTAAWDFHPRSHLWSVSAVVVLFVTLALALLPSRLAAVGAGVVAGGVFGNVVTARLHDARVPNPLVVGVLAFNPADVFILVGMPLLTFALARLAIEHRELIDRYVPPRRWELALRRRLGL